MPFPCRLAGIAFHSALSLVMAETELHGPLEHVQLPNWLSPHVVREVTGEDQYLDENLAC